MLNENVLVEGTQGTFLSLWHGTYPFVTSKDVTASGICADVGLGPTKVDEVLLFSNHMLRVLELDHLTKNSRLKMQKKKVGLNLVLLLVDRDVLQILILI